MKRHQIQKWVIFICLLSMITLTSCFLVPKEEDLPPPPLMETRSVQYDLHEVELEDVENTLRAFGTITNRSKTALYFSDRRGRLKSLNVRIGQMVKQGDILAELDTENLKVSIVEQEIRLKKAQLTHEKNSLLGVSKYDLEISALNMQLEELRLNQLKRELADSRLFAPFNGEIIYVVSADEGEWIDTYRTIVQLAKPRDLELMYKGSDSSKFTAGMEVSVEIDDINFPGKVVSTPLDLPFDAPENLKNTVFFQVENMPNTARRGQSAYITVVLESRKDVVAIPRNLVRTYLGRTFVYVLEDGIKKERSVEIGIQNATKCEIISGLEPGEKVIIR